MKRLICFILVFVFAIGLCACESKMTFSSTQEMKNFLEGVWYNGSGNTVFIVESDEYVKYEDYTMDSYFGEISGNYESVSFENFYDSCKSAYSIDLAGKVRLDTEYVVLEDETIKKSDSETILSKVGTVSEYKEAIKKDFEAEKKQLVFDSKYGHLPTSKDVKYNKFKYLGQNFVISGTAQLDDYYNWDYRGLEPIYFCIKIRPDGGTYSDEWYVYAMRSDFSELYTELQDGPQKVNFVVKTYSYDTSVDDMATLVTYS